MIEKKNPSMMTMLIPWIAFWIAVSIAPKVGALITLIVVAGIPFIMRNHEFVIWDQLSMIAVAVLSAAASVTGNGDIPTNIGYLVFGLFWLLSCLTKEPLCAAYVKYNYGGESAHQNPLFMKTNYILAAAWGLLYVLTAVWTFLLRRARVWKSAYHCKQFSSNLDGIFYNVVRKMVSRKDGKRQEKRRKLCTVKTS